MKILYRVSSNSYKKPRIAEATKEFCLENFIKNVLHKSDEMILIGDNVDAPLKSFLEAKKSDNIRFIDQQFGSNGASFRFQFFVHSHILIEHDTYQIGPMIIFLYVALLFLDKELDLDKFPFLFFRFY